MPLDGPPARTRRSPLRSLPTPPCPRCGAAVPLGVRFCPSCDFPQPIRGTACLQALLIIPSAMIRVSALRGGTTTPTERAARATASPAIRTILPDTPAGNEPGAVTPSIHLTGGTGRSYAAGGAYPIGAHFLEPLVLRHRLRGTHSYSAGVLSLTR
jgi:hypothetical protein